MTITTTEAAYDLSAIPAVRCALADMDTQQAETGTGPAWDALLAAAAQLMDDDIRETLHGEAEGASPATFLAAYCARHEHVFGSRFDF